MLGCQTTAGHAGYPGQPAAGEHVPPQGQGLPMGAARSPGLCRSSSLHPWCWRVSGCSHGGHRGPPAPPDTVCWWLCYCKVGLDPPKVELDPPKFCSRGS